MKGTTNGGRKRSNGLAWMAIAVGLVSLASQGCDSHVVTRRIIVPGAGDEARNPEVAGCVRSCLDARVRNPRWAAACLDQCPGASSDWGAVCETAPPGSGCYVLTTTTLQPNAGKIADVIVAVGEVAEAVDDMRDDDRDEEDTDTARSSRGESRGRHAAEPKRGAKPKKEHKVKRKKQRDVKRKPASGLHRD